MSASPKLIGFFVIILCASSLYENDFLHKWAGFMQMHDLNNDGVIRGKAEVDDLKRFFIKERIPEVAVDTAIENADGDGDGDIDPEEYHDLRMELINQEV